MDRHSDVAPLSAPNFNGVITATVGIAFFALVIVMGMAMGRVWDQSRVLCVMMPVVRQFARRYLADQVVFCRFCDVIRPVLGRKYMKCSVKLANMSSRIATISRQWRCFMSPGPMHRSLNGMDK
ncbi:hypothetical protein CSC3H3_19805 [Thalassospira marina]|uniref:Uncharacterized protein n=1 Tax=Thalassospira marina TaxID=2048283 RepID=A0ABN5FJ68_9PROT|nr:hypothetical protein CSC3H3_19805 [Thalassospira marina]